ncbi:unnamed protein product [Notodromas monacha]|uniref:Uncharacterized protein n=1 Tax=Notodromas monacha TaxID=399045 RepID=A0A7R9BLK9_9CRUS|nr:unnamed protein product [Notodromas monacha]CAG0916926.1 unnamed protein product [Notodromas monacha]
MECVFRNCKSGAPASSDSSPGGLLSHANSAGKRVPLKNKSGVSRYGHHQQQHQQQQQGQQGAGTYPAGELVLEEGDHEIPDGLRFLGEREMSSLGARIPALRRRGAKTNTIRQHYYPEGGWGWVVVACALATHCLCAGAQLAVALLLVHAASDPHHFRKPGGGDYAYEDLGLVGWFAMLVNKHIHVAVRGCVVPKEINPAHGCCWRSDHGSRLSLHIVCSADSSDIFQDDSKSFVVWVGSLCLSTSIFTSPFVVALCRRKSTRLTAVVGGLIMALACLFTSFAQQIHQIFFSVICLLWAGGINSSYGIMLGVGVGLSRETSGLMLGQYFKRRREFVEAIAQSGSGIGITIFSHFFYKVIGDIGWRLGLQAFTGLVFLCFFLGIFYRSASLYHPQRRAILHLKSQKRKVKDTKKQIIEKPPYCDFSSLRSKHVQILMVSNALCGFGIYSPLFHLARNGLDQQIPKHSVVLLYTYCGLAYVIGCIGTGMMVVRRSQNCMISRQYLHQAIVFSLERPEEDSVMEARNGLDQQIPKHSVVLLYTYCGLAYVIGCIGTGMMVVRRSQNCMISRQYLHQAIVFSLGLILFALCMIRDYHGYALFMWLYGLFLGANAYSLRVYTYEQTRARNFARAIAFIQWVAFIPILIGIPITGYINASQPMSGYYFSCSCVMLSGVSLFALNYVSYEEPNSPEGRRSVDQQKTPNGDGRHHDNPENGGPVCLCPASLHKMDPANQYRRRSEASALKAGDYLACIAEEVPNGQPEELQYPGEFEYEYAASCNKVTDFLLYNDFDERYSSSAGPGGPCSTQSHPGILTLPKKHKPSGSSLHNNLSYSEPEALGRIGQQIAAAEAVHSNSHHLFQQPQSQQPQQHQMVPQAYGGSTGILLRMPSGTFVAPDSGAQQQGPALNILDDLQTAGTLIQHSVPGFVREMTTTV